VRPDTAGEGDTTLTRLLDDPERVDADQIIRGEGPARVGARKSETGEPMVPRRKHIGFPFDEEELTVVNGIVESISAVGNDAETLSAVPAEPFAWTERSAFTRAEECTVALPVRDQQPARAIMPAVGLEQFNRQALEGSERGAGGSGLFHGEGALWFSTSSISERFHKERASWHFKILQNRLDRTTSEALEEDSIAAVGDVEREFAGAGGRIVVTRARNMSIPGAIALEA
jgi:hypothetical protein